MRPSRGTLRWALNKMEDGVEALVKANNLALPFSTLAILGYVVMSPLWCGLVHFFGKRVHWRIKLVWRASWLICNSATFGTLTFYIHRFCIGDAGVGDLCTLRPLETASCCATCSLAVVVLFVALFADRVVVPLVRHEALDAYDHSRMERIAWGGSLLVAWGALADLDPIAIGLLLGLCLRRAISPLATLERVVSWVCKGGVAFAVFQTLRGNCPALSRRLTVGSSIAVSLW